MLFNSFVVLVANKNKDRIYNVYKNILVAGSF